MKKTLISLALIVAVVLAGIAIIHYQNTRSETPNQIASNGFSQNGEHPDPIIGIVPSNVATYTSSRLGVTFKYAIFEPIYPIEPKAQVFEEGNRITTSTGGVVQVFDKDPNKSLADILAARMPSCKITTVTNTNSSMDIQVRVSTPDSTDAFDQAGDPYRSPKDLQCIKEAAYKPTYFAASTKYPDRYIGVEASSQSPDGALYLHEDRRVTLWMSTVEFIAK